MSRPRHIDHLLRDWPYRIGDVLARKVHGSNRRLVLQLRIDLGIMQLEMEGRPDGERPEGYATYYHYLRSITRTEHEDFVLKPDQCLEIDREFVQFYYRRIAWLAVRDFQKAVADANHTLALMDLISAYASDEEWAMMHEQYRPFVLFHRTQAAALLELERSNPEQAIQVIDDGLGTILETFSEHDAEDTFDDDELVQRLRDMRQALQSHFEIGPSLSEQLADAIASEQYELAAQLRDQIRVQKQID
ncbi:MAG: UvrB/UvrC motif-containing protein [Pirellulales bacterium]|nr:UvrB/UvrC motif-containing protein [Pirellulales bacterium]